MSDSPLPGESVSKVLAFLREQADQSASSKRFTSARIFDIAENLSKAELARLLSWLVEKHVLEQVIRVQNPYGEGIGDYSNLEEVPRRLRDARHDGEWVDVTLDNLKVLYKLGAPIQE